MKMLIAKGSRKREIETPFSLFFFSRAELKHFAEIIQDELGDDLWRDNTPRWIAVTIPEPGESALTAGRMPELWED